MRNSIQLFLAVLITSAALLFSTGCEKEKQSNGNEHSEPANAELLDSSVVRADGTDIASLDENGDGKLYQCPMHFDVISDTKGRCPECKMYLEEFTNEEAAKNFSWRSK